MRQQGLMSIIIVHLLLIGCGGGSSDNPPPPAVEYNGAKTAADISANNAPAIALSAFEGGAMGDIFSARKPESQQTDADGNPIMALSRLVAQLRRVAVVGEKAGTAVDQKVIMLTVRGLCNGIPQGNASTLSIDYNETTGAFSTNNALLNNYRGCDGALNGAINISGVFDPQINEFRDFNLSFNSLTISLPGKSFTASGSISWRSTGTDRFEVTLNLTYKDNTTNKTYKLENVVLRYVGNGPTASVSISGRFYHHDHGYVDVNTTANITITYVSYYPTQGTIVLNGVSVAGGGPKRITVTYNFNGTYSYQLAIDTDGDGIANSTYQCLWPSTCTLQ